MEEGGGRVFMGVVGGWVSERACGSEDVWVYIYA